MTTWAATCLQKCPSDGAVSMQAVQERCTELETEAAVLTDELTRTSAVAARAAAREVVNGSKDEGVVPVTVHIEEVRLPFLLFSDLPVGAGPTLERGCA